MAFSKEQLDLMKSIKAKYGENAITPASEIPPFEIVPSGSLCLDYITGIGGLPSNRVVEYAGEPGSGKSTLALHTMNNALRMYPDKIAVYFDLEQKLTPHWIANFIDDMDRVQVLNPEHIEQAHNMFRDIVRSGMLCVAVVDSIGGAPTIRTTDKSAETAAFGGNSIGVGEFARAAATLGGRYRCLTIGINQIRQDMSGYRRLMTPGGEAWKHAASLRVQLRRGPDKYNEKVGGEDIQVGYDVIVKTVKSGIGTPFRATKYRFYSQQAASGAFGVDRLDEILRLGKLSGLLEQRGAWIYHPDLPDGKIMGLTRLEEYARTSPGIVDLLEKQIREKILKQEAIEGVSMSFDEELAEQDDGGFLAKKLEPGMLRDEREGIIDGDVVE